jgi:hypothetical protein
VSGVSRRIRKEGWIRGKCDIENRSVLETRRSSLMNAPFIDERIASQEQCVSSAKQFLLVGLRGFEPMTFALSKQRSKPAELKSREYYEVVITHYSLHTSHYTLFIYSLVIGHSSVALVSLIIYNGRCRRFASMRMIYSPINPRQIS